LRLPIWLNVIPFRRAASPLIAFDETAKRQPTAAERCRFGIEHVRRFVGRSRRAIKQIVQSR
jgi:hypothetical protein